MLESTLNPDLAIFVRVVNVLMDLLPFRRKYLSLLAEEFQKYLPQFEPYTNDYQMVVYACRDFEEWARCEWNLKSNKEVYGKLEETSNREPAVFKLFLNYWTNCWLQKWRERVKLLSTKPKMPPDIQEKIKESQGLYREMEQKRELKKMVTQRLIRQGEISLPENIAETRIIEEITKRLQNADINIDYPALDSLELLNTISYRISQLHEEKGPLIYMSIRPHMP